MNWRARMYLCFCQDQDIRILSLNISIKAFLLGRVEAALTCDNQQDNLLHKPTLSVKLNSQTFHATIRRVSVAGRVNDSDDGIVLLVGMASLTPAAVLLLLVPAAPLAGLDLVRLAAGLATGAVSLPDNSTSGVAAFLLAPRAGIMKDIEDARKRRV